MKESEVLWSAVLAFLIGALIAVGAAIGQPAFAQQSVEINAPVTATEGTFAEDALPPEWLISLMEKIKAMPIVGPVLVTALQIIAIIGSFATLLFGFLLASIKLLVPVLDLARLTKFSDFIEGQQKSKWMYWLKYVSFLNAKKPDEKPKV